MRLAKLAEKLSEDSIRELLKLKRRSQKVGKLKKELAGFLKKAARVAWQIAKLEGKVASRPRRRLSAAGRKKISLAQKKRWAATKGKKKAATA